MKKPCLALLALAATLTPAHAAGFDFEQATIPEVQRALRAHRLTCRALVQACLDRIDAYDQRGPKLNAILTLNPRALDEADRRDDALRKRGAAGPLHCVPIVLKDNYDTADLPTTGGSRSLAGSRPGKDAFVVARLRAAGALVLAKTNMHEFALSGTTMSSLGGQTLNPYDLTRTPGGSSGGTGAALAAGFALAGTGSDTVNSIRSPASANALVGIRPTHGLVSLTGIMPVSSTQDAIGPLARHVVDVAAMLQVMAAADPADPQTLHHPHGDYRAALDAGALKGRRIGVLRTLFGTRPEHAEVDAVMQRALAALGEAGAVLVDIDAPDLNAVKLIADNDVQKYEFRAVMDRYLATVANAPLRTVDAIVASGNYDHPTLENFLKSATAFRDGLAEPDYRLRLERNVATRALLTKVMDDNRVEALVYPLQRRLVVPVTELNQADRNGILASVTGFPAITVPAGFSAPTPTAPLGVPVGMDILGRPWSEARLLAFAYAFEQATKVRQPPRSTPALEGK
ncbi:MAG: amidase family protein [Xanthobacteraceae bacterium]|nr:amidase family protein [Xanthobacteraceae bacterium]